MATHKIGKLKFNISRGGLAFRWGEGEIRRLPFGLKSARGDGEAGEFDPYEDGLRDDAYGADGEYDRYDDDYADEAEYADDEYADYDEGDYADGEYADGEYADGEYADDGYYDENGEYIGGSEGSIMQYIDENDWVTYALLVLFPPVGIYLLWRRGQFDTVMRAGISAASAIWFVAILWIIIALASGGAPDPYGTSGGMSFNPTPTIMSIATPTPSATATPTPSATLGLDETPAPTPIVPGQQDGGTTGTETVYSPATGIYYHKVQDCPKIPAGAVLSRVTVGSAQNRGQSACPDCFGGATTYYATENGHYYHSDQYCSKMTDAKAITEAAAKQAGKSACPVCILKTARSLDEVKTPAQNNAAAVNNYIKKLKSDKSGIKVWATKGGKYFHTNATCSDMKNASNITLLAALQAGKSACPVCASAAGRTVYATPSGTYYHKASTCSSGLRDGTPMTMAAAMAMGKKSCPTCIGNVKVPTGGSAGESEKPNTGSDGTVYVYATSNGNYYHVKSDCQGMTGADRVPLKTMLAAGRPACPVCASAAGKTVYAVKGGKYYHSYATCSGMSGATAGSLAQALAYGYEKCPTCWASGGGDSGGGSSVSGVSVYRTNRGKYYHTNATCSGMSGASKVTLEAAVAEGKTACQVCASAANKTVYATQGGKYYHYNQTCSDMKNAKPGTLADALMHGFAPCPVCVKKSGDGSTGGSSGKFSPGTSGIKVYASQSGEYYHLSKSHAGSGASYITLETALNYGKTACPDCAKKTADRTVYAASGDKYFHATKAHAGSGAKAGSAAEALAFGLKACPVCLAAAEAGIEIGEDIPKSSDTFNPGASGLKVYATLGGSYFHASKAHAGSGASHVTLETAINYGKKPCPECAASAYKKVYATLNGKYYHYDKACAGSEASSGYLAIALAMGKDPCPICVKGSGDSGNSGGSGNSGNLTSDSLVYIDVQGDSNPDWFHKSSKCSKSGMKSSEKVTLGFAKDQDMTPCPHCW